MHFIPNSFLLGVVAIVSLAIPLSTAKGEELREFCSDRPGIAVPPCTIDKGHFAVEVGAFDWTREQDDSSRTDTITTADILLRYGIGSHTEVQADWAGLGHVRTRDRMTGDVMHQTRPGDLTLRLRQNLQNPDGSGISIALSPYVTLPVGREPVGAGDWAVGLDVPMSFDIGHNLAITSDPSLAAEVNSDGSGRHFAFGSTIGLSMELTKILSATIELAAIRDLDPSGHSTSVMGGASLSFKASERLHLDIGSNIGLNHAAPDAELYVGLSRRF